MKAVAFHASLSATWVDANGSKWEYEFWFGNNTMNPAVERCWLKTWREQEFLVHEEPNLCNLKSSPKELMRVLLDEAVKFQSYHIKDRNCLKYFAHVAARLGAHPEALKKLTRYDFSDFCPWDASDPHSPTHSILSPLTVSPPRPKSSGGSLVPLLDLKAKLDFCESDEEESDEEADGETLARLRNFPWGSFNQAHSWDVFPDKRLALAIIQADDWPTTKSADIRLLAADGHEKPERLRGLTALCDPRAPGSFLLIPNRQVKEALIAMFAINGVDPLELQTLDKDCSPNTTLSSQLSPSYLVKEIFWLARGSTQQPGLVLEECPEVPMAVFSVAANTAIFKSFRELARCYGQERGGLDHGVRGHISYVLTIPPALRSHDPVYLALKDIWEGQTTGEALFEQLLDGWSALQLSQEPQTIKLKEALAMDSRRARTYRAVLPSHNCAIS